MQEEVTQRTVALCVEATKLSAGMLQQAMKKVLDAMQKGVTDHKTKKPKLPFPQSWAGQPQEVIEQKSGLEGISFCHASRFLITAKDKETALAACRHVLKNNGRL